MFCMKPQFLGIKAAASNIGHAVGNYTAEMFQQDFPQFFTADGESLLPETMLNQFISRANTSIQPDKWLDGWRYAAGLYVAHYATLYLRTFAPASETAGQAAATGALVGVVKSETLGDTSVTYFCIDQSHRGLGQPERHPVWSDSGDRSKTGGHGWNPCYLGGVVNEF